jgi:hypothetical protein
VNSLINAHQSEIRLFKAIQKLTAHNKTLLNLLFDSDSDRLELRNSPDKIILSARGLCGSDYILIKLCLDLWCEKGKIAVHELFNLDRDLLRNTLQVIEELACGF